MWNIAKVFPCFICCSCCLRLYRLLSNMNSGGYV
ncbi:hypothetical protein AAZV13_08G044200 [Glycine max]